jgi:hypothetical protein
MRNVNQQIRWRTPRLMNTAQAMDNVHGRNWRTKAFGLCFRRFFTFPYGLLEEKLAWEVNVGNIYISVAQKLQTHDIRKRLYFSYRSYVCAHANTHIHNNTSQHTHSVVKFASTNSTSWYFDNNCDEKIRRGHNFRENLD